MLKETPKPQCLLFVIAAVGVAVGAALVWMRSVKRGGGK